MFNRATPFCNTPHRVNIRFPIPVRKRSFVQGTTRLLRDSTHWSPLSLRKSMLASVHYGEAGQVTLAKLLFYMAACRQAEYLQQIVRGSVAGRQRAYSAAATRARAVRCSLATRAADPRHPTNHALVREWAHPWTLRAKVDYTAEP